MSRAKDYFDKAIKVFNILGFIWGCSIAEGYMSLLLIKEWDYENALNHLKKADRYAYKMKGPLALEQYCNKGIDYLKDIKECYEINTLKFLKGERGNI